MSQIPATEQYIAARLCEGSTPRGWRAIADALDAAARTLAAAIPAGAHHPDSQAALDARRVGNLTAAAIDARRRAAAGDAIVDAGGPLFSGGDESPAAPLLAPRRAA